MKTVSILHLKATLSATIAEAEAGATILVTRHGEAVAQVGPPAAAGVHVGRQVGAYRLRPAIRQNTRGRYLKVLDEDRGDR
jgi:antitoxin (DNA-binding transcriptional repressor) of toxin-antitoxin stability system